MTGPAYTSGLGQQGPPPWSRNALKRVQEWYVCRSLPELRALRTTQDNERFLVLLLGLNVEFDGLLNGVYTYQERVTQADDGQTYIIVSDRRSAWRRVDDSTLWSSVIATGSSEGRTLPDRFSEMVNVLDFGADKTGTDDSTSAIQAAADYAATLTIPNEVLTMKPVLYFPPGKGYLCAGGIEVARNIQVRMEAPIIYSGSGTALKIGEEGPTKASYGPIFHRIRVRRASQSPWTDPLNDIGVKIVNLMAAQVWLEQVEGFAVGAKAIGSGHGVVYVRFQLVQMVNNQVAFLGTNETNGGSIGWFNQNQICGGRITVDSGVHRNKSRYGIRITSEDGTYPNNNSNVIDSVSFELKYEIIPSLPPLTGGAIAGPVEIIHGLNNMVVGSCRSESNKGWFMRCDNNSRRNIVFSLGFTDLDGGFSVVNSGTYASNFIVGRGPGEFIHTAVPSVPIFHSGPLHKQAAYYDGATKVHVARCFAANSGGSTAVALANITIASDYISMPSSTGVGVYVDTKVAKRFLLQVDANSGNGGRVAIRCYDAAGVVLTDADPGHPYCKGSLALAYAASFGGAYRSQSDPPDISPSFDFEVGEDVQKIAVIVAGGSAVIELRSFSIFALDGHTAAVWPGYEEIVPGANLALVAPTAGTYEDGKIVFNAAGGFPAFWRYKLSTTTWVYDLFQHDGTAGTVGLGTTPSTDPNVPMRMRKDAAAFIGFQVINLNTDGAAGFVFAGSGGEYGGINIAGPNWGTASEREWVRLFSGPTAMGIQVKAPTAGQEIRLIGNVGGSVAELERLDGLAVAGETAMWIFDKDGGSLHRVKVGANGTGPGGTGRALYFDDV